jgi:hypothetical protein
VFDRLTPLARSAISPVTGVEQVAELREYLAGVQDPRDRRGVRIRRVAADAGRGGGAGWCAVVSRDREWVVDVPQRVLAVVGAVRRSP